MQYDRFISIWLWKNKGSIPQIYFNGRISLNSYRLHCNKYHGGVWRSRDVTLQENPLSNGQPIVNAFLICNMIIMHVTSCLCEINWIFYHSRFFSHAPVKKKMAPMVWSLGHQVISERKQSGRSPKVVALFSATNFSSNIIELLQLHDTIKM